MAYSTSTLAKGCFGKVYKEKYNDTWAAIKKVPQHLISRKDLQRECDVYNKVSHPNIVKLLGNINLKDGKWVIPLEFIFGEDLETTIFKSSRSKIQLTPSNKGTIIIGMCEGLLFLHSKDVVHQDLKPENIMVEHNTNRAVIIDLGLAKFFKHGLNSAVDMGNEAYSAPEVLQRRSQRDQRSDVWAMGKIIAELCARIRLYTPSVCPAKIKETLQGQPYCHAVCRMVETNPSVRASMGGVISDIRRAGGAGIVTDRPVRQDHLLPPSSQINARNRTPSPMNRAPSPFHRDPSPLNRAPSPFNPLPRNRSPEPLKWERSPKPQPARHLSPSPHRTEDKKDKQALVPTGAAGVTQDFMKMRLYQEAAKDLPCNLPTTGRVVVRRFEKKNGEVGTWEQREVVTRDGKIVKYDDVKFNSN
ncbi:spindle assembly checkpoint kinase [Thunnus albacares]|uniref:spindle assembly checkpoint kinase n=1 Tax=Thunnus albacares TaxID=8236 RepID=UPI001CF6723E|nr:spindle assembly checkpoint kinase [Thunnus albacares]